MARFRAVVFDLFGTLIETAPFEEYAAMTRRMADVLGMDAEAFHREWLESRPDRINGSIPSLRENFNLIAERLGTPPPSGEAAAKAQAENENYLRPILMRAKPDALDTLAELKRRGLRLGLLSDCYRTTAKLWPQTPMAPYFDAAVFSCEAGHRKPASELYRLISERLGTAPPEILYAGDGGGNEMNGAARAGMTAVLVENALPDAFLPESHHDGASHRVGSLHAILHLVEGETPPGL
jgi:putative hydrolase of the HAD superfamily